METLTQPDELLPCPFCGGPAVSWYAPYGDLLTCCGAPQQLGDETCCGKYCKTHPDAWNTRATPRIDDQVDVEAFKKLIVAADFLHEAISECRVADDQYSDAFEAWLKYKLVCDQITAHYNLTRKGE